MEFNIKSNLTLKKNKSKNEQKNFIKKWKINKHVRIKISEINLNWVFMVENIVINKSLFISNCSRYIVSH